MRGAPHLPKQLLVRDDLPGVTNERRQELVLDRRQVDFLVVDQHLAAQEVDAQLSHLEGGLVRLVRRAGGVAERDADPREQLAGAERLAHVVVGARVERRDLVALLAAGREHDDRDVGPLAHAPDDFEAVHVGQPEVDDDDVGLARAHFHDAISARRGLEELVALAGQRRPQEAPDLWLVLDQDDDGLRHQRARPRVACPPVGA